MDSVGIVGLAGLLGSVHLVYPFGADQGEYGYAASALLSGETLYRDIFTIKPPATHLLHLAAILLFGKSMAAIRIFDLLWQAATALTVRGIAVRIYDRRDIGFVAAAIFLVTYFRFGFFHSAQTDGFLNLPAALAVWTFLVGLNRGARAPFVASGLAIAIAVLFKYPIGILLLFFGALLLWRRRYGEGLCLGAGFGAGILACIVWLAAAGGLGDFLATFTLLPAYSLTVPRKGLDLLRGARQIFELPWILFLGAFVVELWSLRHALSQQRVVLLAWWSAAIVHLVAQLKFWDYHWLALLAPSSILLAAVLARGCDAIISPARRGRLAFALLAVVSLGACSAWQCSRGDAAVLRKVLAGNITLDEAYGRFAARRYSIAWELELARYLRDHTAPDETIFLWGYQPTVYFIADRKCASRFTFDVFLVPKSGWSELFRDDLLADLERNAPRYVVVVVPEEPLIDGLQDFLDHSYFLERRIDGSDLYRRTESADFGEQPV
jgi:hypothetical protein